MELQIFLLLLMAIHYIDAPTYLSSLLVGIMMPLYCTEILQKSSVW